MFQDDTTKRVIRDDTVAVRIVLGVITVKAAAIIAGVIYTGLQLLG
jgi:hypothetical protein